ncbi:MAG: carbohydrate ABC transporter permease [Ardenticatenaceae bacterium]|nr:carbohydrate ABC transporter permease [Ardenticatenaceae bacterium]MCB9446557.1 carbohydrate ABC transporter permease [Ardenticatenaceae bacterium]
MRARKVITNVLRDIAMFVTFGVVFIVPFIFILLNAAKTRQEAALLEFSWPSEFQLWENLREVMVFGDNRMALALWNSTLLTVGSVTLIVLFSALVAFVMQRRSDRLASVVGSFMLAGLIIPPAVVPTVFFLQWIGLYKTLFGMIMVDVAYTMPFAILIFRTFMNNIPRELDESAIIDGASPMRVFFNIILPLLRPAIVTVVVTSSVTIFNDFVGPLYFLPGSENVTAPLTLFSFISQFSSQWNLLFADVVIMTIIPFIVFLFFQKQLVAGMIGGAIKG